MTEEKKEKRTIRFFRDVEFGLPFDRIDEGNFEGVVFLVDTGSNKNILFGYAYNQMKDIMKKREGNEGIVGLDVISSKVRTVSGALTFCGQDYDMSFLLKKEDLAGKMLSEQIGFSVAGIIGTEFMAEHDWVIDFRKQEIVIPKGDINASANFAKSIINLQQ